MRREPANAPSWHAVVEDLRARARRPASPEDDVLLQRVLRMVGRARDLRVLDLGCGSGALSAALAERGARVLGLDASPEQIACARDRAAAIAAPALEFRVDDPSRPADLPRREYDLVTCLGGAAGADVLRIAARALRPGGRVVLALAHPWTRGDGGARGQLEALFAALRRAGLRVLDLAEPRDWLVVLAERPRRRPRR